jgi:peptidoglycan hydrolase-like protein with peptidoglycan-binding domain
VRAARQPRGGMGAAIVRHPREFVGIVLAVAATATIFVNALFLQRGPHPAPIFSSHPLIGAAPPHRHGATPTAPSRTQLIADIQRALGRKGFYTGNVDGIWGAATDAAVRDFAQAAKLKINAEASESLLRAISTSSVQAPPKQPAPNDPIAKLLAPSQRVLAIQRALSDFGYGQIKPTGVYDADTRAAIEKFERDQKLPVTGLISETLIRALAAMSGRPLE